MAQRTAQNAKTLPAKYYTDPSVYEHETEKIFSKNWIYCGRSSQIAKPGGYFLFEIDGESIIILRDRQLQARAFYNVCRHRGTRLCTQEHGRFSQTIQCPYHAWTYRLDGTLTGAPNMHEVTSFKKADYPLHAVAIVEWQGCLFINLSAQPLPFAEALAPLMGKFTKWQMEKRAVVHRIEYDLQANWKLVFQNYSECYHCPSLHPALNRLTPYRDSSNDLTEGAILGGPMRFSAGTESMTMSGRLCATPLPAIGTDERQLAYYYTVFPNMLLSFFPDYVLIHRIERRAPKQSRVVCEWLFHENEVAKPDFDPSGAIAFWNMTNLQDWQVSELSQQGICSRAYTPGPYAELESMIAAWDRHYLQQMKNGD